MDLETAPLLLSIGGSVTTIWAWWWLRGLQRSLTEHEGFDLIGIIVWVVGWTAVARMIATVGLFLFDLDRSYANVTIALSIVTQLIGAMIFVGAVVRVRRLLGSPLNRASKAAVELGTQTPGQIPNAPSDIGPTVNNGSDDRSPFPAKLD